MVEFSRANAEAFIDEDDEEAGEEIESAPPLNIGDEREIHSSGLKKKLLKLGLGWETPEFGDEVTVHYVGSLRDGTKCVSTRDKGEPVTFKLGEEKVATGVDCGIVTMRKGEMALFTLPPPRTGFGSADLDAVSLNSVVQFEVELVSWITVVDVCKDGGIIKKIMEKGELIGPPDDLDEVLVKYVVRLLDGVIVAKTPEHGVEFYVKNGHFCQALPKAIKTMRRGEKVNLIVQPQYAFVDGGKDPENGFPSIPPSSILSIDLELVSFKPVINVTGDLGVLKKILKEGEGTLTANEGATVTIRYTAKLEDGTLLEKRGFDGVDALKYTTDEEHVVAGLDKAVTIMKKGEHAIVTVKPDYGFGSTEVKRDLAMVPPCSTIVFEVEMLEFTKEKDPWEMNKHERIQVAQRKKEEGNLLFKNGKYQRAMKKYEKAVDYINEDGTFEDDDRRLVKSLRVSCWLNGAACCLKQNDFQEAIKHCSKVLEIESCNVKALYRRAQAFMDTADLHLAELDIKKALEIDPQNREVKLIQKTLKQLQAESNKKDAKVYTTMFARMSNENSSAAKRLKVEAESKIEENVGEINMP
ncbi:PREDICTED: peptidyl-prolyl cis-trans isomerase FKBP62-like [Nicotiana attenuata]|uniref:peptidylprolyl isomerase n=1 Tax=Nicotiana attenuata TaxID=49451 RepID=A0A314KJC4_NICAT|nr:PREDICTED: peptidyl-prolyl cis-trans isomerase FKBP62-like [Nicotiana attenuata]OIT29292.1 70 kda peptidyl-prolyl isomerase [Nicotiana attenuata]